MKLYDIIENLKFVGIKHYKDVDIDALSCNSQEIMNNGIYFCIKGLSQDGHEFANEAISNGAVCLVVEKYLDIPITQVLVEDVRSTMSYISSIFFSTYKSKMKFVGITGTNGKTTSTYLVRDILTKMGKKVGLIGTQGIYIGSLMLPNKLTTPDPIDLHRTIRDMENNDCEYCVMEVSAHSIALNKIDNIYYDVVGLTNVTKDHLDYFITMDNYAKCKASLFDSTHAKMGVVNIDTKVGRDIQKRSNIEISSFGQEGDLKIIESKQTMIGSSFKVEYKNKSYLVKTNLIGEYNISNMMMAISVLTSLGYDIRDIISTIRDNKFMIPGRFNMLTIPTDYHVMVDYAHTPDGIKSVLSAVKKMPVNRIITVFGCGGNRDRTKRSEMGDIAVLLSDYVIVTSDNPRDENPEMIIDDIVRDIDSKNIVRITDRRSAIEYALSIAKPNDIIAILGKGAETYQEIKGVKYHYSDYEVVDNYFKYYISNEMKA
ncbi:MAG: UDP-N-acetylmuramoyl-L-alanyl-D-glutamate--2,6-diaminopimelate ligase [Clostridia bacterium]|nr:UDP-N-acetylmuramoyl-L-alanyl-D-glutamate--2,6-diaminopimelate ligase [Clostridia bacterium]